MITRQFDIYWDDLCQDTQKKFIIDAPEWTEELNKDFPIANIIIEYETK